MYIYNVDIRALYSLCSETVFCCSGTFFSLRVIFFFFFVAGNSVEVDESLFQEMDDLELEDDEDDPDYNPVNLDSD